ncbi:MAG TPA: hypothetical protein PLK04_11255 [Bacillota bacterium]|jgi:redox-sensitive bicupin YhaK (pirin superfamily)|nr:hypothetical protein [Bacillota bacterium]
MTVISAIVLVLALAIVVLWRARAHQSKKARRFEENKRAARISLQTGSMDLPSWVRNEGRLSEFLFTVQRLALRKGMPHRTVLEALATEHLFVHLICLAGALEVRKATFAEQQMAVAETIAQRYEYDERMRAEAEILFADGSAMRGDL